jgi:hypothetical protein
VGIRPRTHAHARPRSELERWRGSAGQLDTNDHNAHNHNACDLDNVDKVEEARETEEAGAARQPGAGAGGV